MAECTVQIKSHDDGMFRLWMTAPYWKAGRWMELNEFDIAPRWVEFHTVAEAETWIVENGHTLETPT